MTTLSRHDKNLLSLLEDFILEIGIQFEPTDEYQNYKGYLDDSFSEALRIVSILKDKIE